MKGRLIPYTKAVGFRNNNNFHKLNESGLNKAYNNHNKIHVEGDTMYIGGTSNLKDVYDDVVSIPIWGSIKNSTRYKQAKTALDNDNNITKLVGHSLGGSIALEFEKDNAKYASTTYGAPVLQGNPLLKGNRFRFKNDLVSMFDMGAITVNDGFRLNPHSYSNY